MTLLDQDLGKSLTASEVAKYLKTTSVTVRNNYESLGGIRLGSKYIFFEKSLINAILYKGTKAVDGTNYSSNSDVQKGILDETRGEKLGNSKKRNTRENSYIKDTHNLID